MENKNVMKSFLKQLRQQGHLVQLESQVARSNAYLIDGKIHLLVRTSTYHQDKGFYYFGLTRHIFEKFAQLRNARIAFVFVNGKIETIFVPAQLLFKQSKRISISRDGYQYKLPIDKAFCLHLWEPKDTLPLGGFPHKLDSQVALKQNKMVNPERHTHLLRSKSNLRQSKKVLRKTPVKHEYVFPNTTSGLLKYLDPDVGEFMNQLAVEKKVDVRELVNTWLRANMSLVRSIR